MWLSVVCTLVDNDTCHYSGQNVVQQIEVHHCQNARFALVIEYVSNIHPLANSICWISQSECPLCFSHVINKIVIYIYRSLSKDIRKKEAPWMRRCKEVDCCTYVNLPTNVKRTRMFVLSLSARLHCITLHYHNECSLAQVQTLAHWSLSPSDKFPVTTMCWTIAHILQR